MIRTKTLTADEINKLSGATVIDKLKSLFQSSDSSDEYNHYPNKTKDYNNDVETLDNIQFLTNLKIIGIPETYGTDNTSVLNREGTLAVATLKDDGSINSVNIYDLFNDATGITQSNIPFYYDNKIQNAHPILETMHRVVLEKNTTNSDYQVHKIYLGKEDNLNLYSMDIPAFTLRNGNNTAFTDAIYPSDDGIYRLEEDNPIYWIYTSFKPFMYVKVSCDGLKMIIRNNSDETDINNMTQILLNNGDNYIIIDFSSDSILTENDSPFINFYIMGDANTDSSVLLEFF